MVADIPAGEAVRLAVDSWRVLDGTLHLRFSGSSDERILRCVCGRSHWILETRDREGRVALAVKCHGCGTTATIPLGRTARPSP